MSVFFGVKLKLSDDFNPGLPRALTFNKRRILDVGPEIAEEEFDGWRDDLSIRARVPFSPLIKSQSDEVYLLLPKYYYDGGFTCDRIIVPEYQDTMVWNQYERIQVENWRHLCDVTLFQARYNDMFCVIDRTGWTLYVVLPGELYVRRFTRVDELEQIADELKSKCKSARILLYLTNSYFSNRHWCDADSHYARSHRYWPEW